MYKLMVIAGPNRGTSFAVQEGENCIGRQTGNAVVLPSAKVSKRHCVLVVNHGEVILQDQGSSNGTFVNGVLAKARKLKTGDRISVGEYVLELTQPQSRPSRPALGGMGSVIPFPGAGAPGAMPAGLGATAGTSMQSQANPMPKDLKGKLLWVFENRVMPVFYKLNLKHEWRVICIGAFALFAVGNLAISVYPLLEQNRRNVVKEVEKRASFMASQIAERNAPALAARAETKTEVGSIEDAEGVRVAVLMDMEGRILAPAAKLNQYLSSGPEAAFATKARNAFRSGRERGVVQGNDELVIAVEPVRVVSQQAGKNVAVAMALVSVDSSLSTQDMGEMGMTYSETLILTGILGGLILLVLYRLTLKPLATLNEDMDKVLKGDLAQVTREFKFEELDQLWDIINSALQRVPKGGAPGDGMGGMGGGGVTADDIVGPLRMIGDVVKLGLVVCDGNRKILHANSMFEEISGIRADGVMGQDIASVARDQSLAPFMNDLFDRCSGGMNVVEDYDFSGISHRCHAAGFGSPARCYVFVAVRAEGQG